MKPDVSVVIPTYNRLAMVCEAIDSVLAQERAAFELIVVDDGSTDGTAEHLRSRYKDTIRLESVTHRGVAAARNHGVSMAQADLIAFLDSDDLWMPSKLNRQCGFMRDHREYRIAQCQEIWMRQGKRVNPGVRHSKRSGDIFVDSLRTCLLSPSAVIMTAELFAEMQGFDEAMEACEDYDLWLRISLAQSVGLMNEKLVTRRAGHPGQLSAIVPALDRFRIRALLKILASGRVNVERTIALSEVLAEKCRIYAQGLHRRDNEGEAAHFRALAERAKRLATQPKQVSGLRHWLENVPSIAAQLGGSEGKWHRL